MEWRFCENKKQNVKLTFSWHVDMNDRTNIRAKKWFFIFVSREKGLLVARLSKISKSNLEDLNNI